MAKSIEKSDFNNGKILICSVFGYKYVSLDGKPEEKDFKAKKTCSYCIVSNLVSNANLAQYDFYFNKAEKNSPNITFSKEKIFVILSKNKYSTGPPNFS